MLEETNISYLRVNLSSIERPKLISILYGLTSYTFIGGNVSLQIITLHVASVFVPAYGVLERMQLKTENNKTFLVNVKWAGRVNVLLYPKGPHNKKTGPL